MVDLVVILCSGKSYGRVWPILDCFFIESMGFYGLKFDALVDLCFEDATHATILFMYMWYVFFFL